MAKTDREKIANRLYTDANGLAEVNGESVDEATATGVRYECLDGNGKVFRTFEVDARKTNPKGALAMQLFGWKTWIGNLDSQVRNGKGNLTHDDVQARIDSVFRDGEWPERQGIGGPRYDVDALALAIAQAKGETDPAPYLKRLNEEGAKYGNMAMKVPAVLDKYNAITGKGAGLGDL